MSGEPVYTARPRSIRVRDEIWLGWQNQASLSGLSLTELIHQRMAANPGSALTGGGGVTATTKAATHLVGHESRTSVASDEGNESDPPPSVSTDVLCDDATPDSVRLPTVQAVTGIVRTVEASLEKLAKVQALKTEREFHPDPKPVGRKKKR